MISATALGGACRRLNHQFHPVSLAALSIHAIAICASNVGAAVVGTSGNVQEIAAPASVVLSALEDNSVAQFFLEREALSLPSDLALDVTQPGLVDGASDLTPGQLIAGTSVTSYLIHADPIR